MKKIKWGVIGCGGIAKSKSIPGMMLAKNAELVAVADLNGEMAEAVKEQFGAKYAFTKTEDLLALKEIDAIYIASPLFCHKEQVFAAAKAKKNILVEKPMGLNSKEVEEMIDVCKKEGVKLGAAFMLRFHKHHQLIKKMVAEGALGEITSIKAEWSFDYPKKDGIWRQDIKLGGGGGLYDVGSHCIDIMQYMTGLKVEEVVALAGNQIYDYTVDDYSSMLARMNNNSVMFISANYNTNSEPSRFEICGTKGAIVGVKTFSQSGNKADVDLLMVGEEPRKLLIEGEHVNMYGCEMEGFGDAILNNTEPPVPAEDCLFVQKVIDAAYESNNTGKRIKVK